MLCLFSILLIFIISYITKLASSVGVKVSGKAIGPGFESQVPHILQFYYFLYNHVLAQAKGPPCALRIQPLDLQEARSEGHHWRIYHVTQSTRSMESRKSTWTLALGPRICFWHTPICWLQAHFLLSFLFIFSLFNSFKLFLLTKINSFFIKS